MLTLAIETSSPHGSLALLDGPRCLAERELELGKQHGQILVPEIRRLLHDLETHPPEIRLVAVSLGPGSYTGLRIGVVCAKTFAWTVGCPVVGVETLLAIAANSPLECDRVTVIADAQRNALYVGEYAREKSQSFQPAAALRIVGVEEWIGTLTGHETLSGPGITRPDITPRLMGRILPAELRRPRAAQIGILGQSKLARDGADSPETLAPLYLQRSSAEQQWDQLGRP